ncbi:TRAP transporter small permease [Nitratireductor kimnyeongensis]|uniref:TRAP transporter small permease protein n=1 Tax=Nitratireductor kimnyeongensis TaxID=430679 RepID=A0ABW0T7B6_9HYPH|nr:TRAP transporter small permease [Nitratireductor kimnyeongensis]QZZ36447.1 TRAP transporter small permease [Nitratireductor kimnyeongensis]
MSCFYNLHRWLMRILFIISALALAAMVIFTSADIALRNFTGSSIPGSYEYVQRYLMPLLVFPALAHAYESNILPSTTLLTDRMSPTARQALFVLFRLIDIAIFALITWFGLQYALDATSREAAFLAGGNMVPLYPVLYIVPAGTGLLVLELIQSSAKQFREAAEVHAENLSAGA